METKKEIRKRIIEQRNNMTNAECVNKSLIICEKVIGLNAYKAAKKVLVFISYQSEVLTDSIINKCYQDGKEVYAPTVCGNDMRFFRIDSKADLVEGYKGILEPKVSEDREYVVDCDGLYEGTLIIMPGVVFDTTGNRIGYGKGFYDRFLSEGFCGSKVAVAFDLQVVEPNSFISEETDIKPDFIVTETKLFDIKCR